MIRPTLHVLLVEHEPLLANVTRQMLRKSVPHRYEVLIRTTHRAALVALETEPVDVVLLDLNLPDSAGRQTLAAIMEAAPEVPVIVLTATHADDLGLQALKLGAQDFLVKGDCNFLTLDRAITYSIERHRLRHTLQQLAVMDELTGLYNRRGFQALFRDVRQRVHASDQRGFLCYFDLDRFKQINDARGHPKGDAALVEFAGYLRSAFRKDALHARLGGDEFVVLGIESEPGRAEAGLRALDVALAARNRSPDAEFQLECSSGIAFFDGHGRETLDELVTAADAALYRCKEARRAAAK